MIKNVTANSGKEKGKECCIDVLLVSKLYGKYFIVSLLGTTINVYVDDISIGYFIQISRVYIECSDVNKTPAEPQCGRVPGAKEPQTQKFKNYNFFSILTTY